nr:FecR domain-containing protein [Brevundimonas diminuta]
MSDPQSATGVADREAAEWHVRLGERPVSASTLAEFREWRQTPENTAAYQKLEALWRAAGSLSADADVQTVTQNTLRKSRETSRRRRRLIPAVAGLAVAAVAAVAVCLWMPDGQVYETAIGEQRLVRLEDGSQVRLDTDTRLKVRYAGAERRIVLDQGQALFLVAHDAQRPFRVSAGETLVTALGTTFDVRRERTGARVTLVNGSVAVTDEADGVKRWRLTPGQQVATMSPGAAPRPVDAAEATSWSEGRLVFRGTPLRVAVAEVNRYLPEKITLAAGETEAVAVNGVFAVGDRDAFVSAVSDLFGLTARSQSDGGVRLEAPSVGG